MHRRTDYVWMRLMLAATCIGVSACGGTLGPLVTDVRYGVGGELLVTHCMLDISGGGNVTTYKLHDCRRSRQPAPGASVAEAPAVTPSPAGSSGTVVR